jgi:CBS domain-containing protein
MASASAPVGVSNFDGFAKQRFSRRVRASSQRFNDWAWLQTPVAEIMTRKVISVTADLRIEQLILLLIHENVSGVPVVDRHGRPIGIVSKTDLVADDYDWAELREETRRLDHGADLFIERLFASKTVGDIMTSGVLTAHESLAIPAAGGIMAESHTHRLPVVNDGGDLVGIVSSLDVSRWVAARMNAVAR